MAKHRKRDWAETQDRLDRAERYLRYTNWVECPLAITDSAVPPVGRELTDDEASVKLTALAVIQQYLRGRPSEGE